LFGLSLTVPSVAADGTLPFQVPDGFVVEPVARAPLVKYPMLGAFDDQGRLFVCESAGLNLDAEQLLRQLPNSVRMLEDTDGDGQFDKSTVFADKLTLPSGALWHDGALYVTSPPSLWRLEDTDGDGVADRRDELITGFKFRGHAGDVHGPHLGPNGRLYFLDGIMGHEIHDKDGRLLSEGHAARVFSSRPDGTDLETFCGGGMANPVAVTFTEDGEMFGATTFFTYNTKDRIRHDAFFHCVYGGVYPRKVGLLRDEFKLTGSLLPPLTRFGMSAPSNLICYRSGAFGDEYRGDIFIAHFNTHSVTRSRLERDGSTFQATDEPFLVSANSDFHPCDVIEDADGSLLVIDTGGWFKIGCPTSSLQPEVHGAIYRIRRDDLQSTPDPRGLKIAWDGASAKLVKWLGDDRIAVRDRAIATLAKRGEPAIESLRQTLETGSVPARRSAVWALTRIGSAAARTAARDALQDADPSVRSAACISAATHRDTEALGQLARMVRDAEPAVCRQAAAALGRIGRPEPVRDLLQASADPCDRMLEHALIFAIIEINAPEETLRGLEDPSSTVRRAALVALDQMEHSVLTRELVLPLLDTNDALLLEAVVDVVGRHTEWVELVTGVLENWLLAAERAEARHTLLRDTVYALRREPTCQALMAELLSRPDTSPDARILLLDVMVDSGFGEFPAGWLQPVLANSRSSNVRVARRALDAMASTDAGQFDNELTSFTDDSAQPVSLRVRAVDILSRNRFSMSEQTFELLSGQCGSEAAFHTRLSAARAIGNAELSAEQLSRVIDLVAQAGPLELPLFLKPLSDVGRNSSGQAAQRLIAALERSPGFASLGEEQLTALFENAAPEVLAMSEPLVRRVKDEYATSIRQVLRTTFNLVGGRADHGKELFFGKRALCSACHRVGLERVGAEEGKEIGPDLSRIGEVRSPRDLLEAILAPSSSLARGFESRIVTTTAGRVYSGVIRQETDEAVTLYTSQREEIRVSRRDIASIVNSTLSIMPQGLERSLTSDELRDLLAYLSSLKGTEP
jgi:putative membrane-bound dehydrogenase-like protein